MAKKLYLECNSGISGDMLVAALIDLGVEPKGLITALKSIPAEGYDIKISRVEKAGLDCCDFDVILDKEHDGHDHDMDYLHGDHEHSHEHHHHHEHRGLREIMDLLSSSDLSPAALEYSRRIFDVLAVAESKAHGIPKDEVHFHEVGAIDSIIDVAAIGYCMDALDIRELIVTSLSEGKGTVRCAHGILPIPVPAVSNICAAASIALEITDSFGEFVTPTGAAAVAALRTSDRLPDRFIIEKVGMGAGKRTYERPSILRAMIIGELPKPGRKSVNAPLRDNDAALSLFSEETFIYNDHIKSDSSDIIFKLETGIDDSTGEELGLVMDRLLEAGAKDVYYIPIYMKKNRPAYQLCVLCSQDKLEEMENIIFHDTTTIGIRRILCSRSVLPREDTTIEFEQGIFHVKKVTLPDGEIRYYPEYESAARLAAITGESYREAYRNLENGTSYRGAYQVLSPGLPRDKK
ncbi:nickel pincer cofactor biosynthesis protein LarC [Butyrivibrio sp. MC2013]|uniref:nickel pincer cofactor biosynthesis protein LarC n=1 Tax=Butyrivibrio sp. MC2013 TaxID=1280686 RepID=UPI00040CE47B|nr:nickel pincer cofactor biosynthesis protein LarC [Butyrivibrio sp. MC2013]